MKRHGPPLGSGPGAERKPRAVGELPHIRSDAGRASSPSPSPSNASTQQTAAPLVANPSRLSTRTMDRAAAVAIAIMQMIATAPEKELRPAIENYLRDEFANIERQTAADQETGDM